MNNKKLIADRLIKRGHEHLSGHFEPQSFSFNIEADKLLNDLDNHSHHFVLACTMDRQIGAKRAWLIPYTIGQEIGGQSFDKFVGVKKERLEKLFSSKNLHRYKNKMGTIFYNAIHKIKNDYNGDARKLWNDNPKSGTVVRRLLEFNGVGVKIATMATNILVRDFKIPMQDKYCIDISPDIQVTKVFKRIGFIRTNATKDELLYCARELYPEYPGIFDYSAWDIGQKWCKKTKPDCDNCYLNDLCPKITANKNGG